MTDKRPTHADDYGGPESLEDLRRRRAVASRKRMRDRGVKTFAERAPGNRQAIKRGSYGFDVDD